MLGEEVWDSLIFQFILKMFSEIVVKITQALPHHLWQTFVFMDLALCSEALLSWNWFGLLTVLQVKGICKDTAYKYILYNYPTLWQQLGENPHMDVMV